MKYPGNRPMGPVLLTALGLAALLIALFTPAAPAQSPAGDPPLVFTYNDANGQGRLSVLDKGEDKATGGRQIQVTLDQNGVQYQGAGIILPLETQMPFRTLITFSLARRLGPSTFFQGTTISGITVSGQGVHYPIDAPESKSDWNIVLGGPATSSGIRGVALAGPILPVERPGIPNTLPLPDALITVQPDGGGREIARARADRNGRFEIFLSPGTYLIVPLPPLPNARLPRGVRQTVTVLAGRITEIEVRYDTGIR
jgi:hypothetical protein